MDEIETVQHGVDIDYHAHMPDGLGTATTRPKSQVAASQFFDIFYLPSLWILSACIGCQLDVVDGGIEVSCESGTVKTGRGLATPAIGGAKMFFGFEKEYVAHGERVTAAVGYIIRYAAGAVFIGNVVGQLGLHTLCCKQATGEEECQWGGVALFGSFGFGLLVGIEIEGHDDSGKSPEGYREFVGIKKVVENTVNIVSQQTQCKSQRHSSHCRILGGAIDTDAGGEGGHEDTNYQQGSWYTLLGEGTNVFAVSVASIAEVGADDRPLVAALVTGVDELVCSWSTPHDGMLFEHANGRCPPVETLKIGGIGGDVGNGLYLVGKVVGGILLVFPQFVKYVALIVKKGSHAQSEKE